MQHTDKAIAEFEAWWRDNMNTQEMDLHRFGDGYACHETNRCWMAWKASRAALVIKLPARDLSVNGGPDSEMGPSAEQYQGAGYNLALDDCRAAIEAAGVTVRG
jgi:hypothetical protein